MGFMLCEKMFFKEKIVSVISSFLFLHLFSEIGETFACKGYFVRGKDYQQRGLIVHNIYRKYHGAPPMELSDELNWFADKCAKNYARRGVIDHHCPYKKKVSTGSVGENIWMSSGTENINPVASANTAVKDCYSEIQDYDFNINDANNATNKTFYDIGHFTQIVWDTSTTLGIGFALNEKKGNVIVMLYYPGGNGPDFKAHVFPPKNPVPNIRDIEDFNGVGRIIELDIMIIILWALATSRCQYYI